jgi:hypothetical protein
MEHHQQRTVFRTRVDRWLAVVTAVYVLVSLFVPIFHIWQVMEGRATLSLAPLLISPVVLCLVALVSVPCYYAFEDEILVIRSGFLRTRIPIRTIRLVRSTRLILSAPAWSLDRLEIRYGRGMHQAIISPVDQSEFLRTLLSRAPQLEWRGADLVVAEDWLHLMPEDEFR